MFVNFRTREISRDAYKLAWRSTLKKKKNQLIIIIIIKKTSCLSSLKCYSSSEKKNRDLFSFYRLLVPRRNVCRNQMGLTIGNEE